jgi:hemoglobin
MKQDIQNEQDVKQLVDSFYSKVMVDEEIGYIFTDIAKISLQEHMPIMYDFWNSMLLHTATYHRNPMIKHIELHDKTPLLSIHFERWLMLWEETIKEHFEGEIANSAIKNAKNIARIMEMKINRQYIGKK